MKTFSIRHYAALVLPWALLIIGCAQEEKILDVESPNVDIEVIRSDDGEVDVQIEKK